MKIHLKKFLNKYKNRIFSFIAVIICIPFFSITSFAYSATYPQYNYNLSNCGYRPWLDNGTVGTIAYPGRVDTDNNVYTMNYSHTSIADEYLFYDNNGSPNNDTWVIPYYSEYDYYFVASFYVWDQTNNFVINDFNLNYCINNNIIPHTLSNKTIVPYSIDSRHGYTMFCKIDSFSENTGLYSNQFFYESPFTIFNTLQYYTASVFVVPKGDKEVLDNIVSAINRQNDLINGGNSSTGGIVSENNSAVDNLNDVVSEYRATEETFFNDFNTNQQAINNDIIGWSWGGLVSCANWVGSTLTDYYNNMGDFRQYIIYPLMLGIALFFLGRGSSIIGHLYRKPTTTFTHTESRSTMSNGVRHTNTVTTRNGGVFRK